MEKKKVDIEKILREKYPHGHHGFIIKTIKEMKLHSDKNHDYAFGGHSLGNFFRVANILSNYPNLDLSDPAIVAMVYAMKQIDAYLWFKSQGHKAKVEGTGERLMDISVYSKIMDLIDSEPKNPCSCKHDR